MKHEFVAQALTIYVGEQDHWHGKPLYAVLVDRLKTAGIAGVSVLHGIEGFGSSGRLHTDRFEVLFEGLPILVEAVDTSDKITLVLPLLDELLSNALVTIHDVRAIRYSTVIGR